jgi:phosphohistidine swiveling domain-containing protein
VSLAQMRDTGVINDSMMEPTLYWKEAPMDTATMIDPPAATALPVPANFPVTWEHADDAQQLWAFQRMHCPEPITPMAGEFIRWFEAGTNAALRACDLLTLVRVRRINTYFFMARVEVVAPAEEVQAKLARSQEQVGALMARLGELWDDTWLPQVKHYLAAWEAFDLPGASLPALLAHLDDVVAGHQRVWEIHGLLGVVSLGAMAGFSDLYQRLFGDEDTLNATRLLQGFPNKTVESGVALWRLSRQALTAPELRDVIKQMAPSDLPAALESTAAGRAFLTALQTYLDEYGRRSNCYFEPADPGWIEDPTPVIKNVKDYIRQPDRDPDAERAALAAERERLIAIARERLKDHPPEVVRQFEFLLKAAQEGTVLMEDHGFWIDFRTMYEVRRVLLEFGRRFAAAGALEQEGDVFYLTIDELRQTAAALPRRDQRRLVAGRRAEMAYFRTITPPAALGTPPQVSADDGTARLAAMFFGAPPAEQQPDSVRGSAGSAGLARGRARVIQSLADAGRLQQGDILVAPTTSPPWTPLFATVAAIVTDTGGVLCHSAIVAREYGIPAVVGTGSATTIIRDGQLVEVDGSAGIVRIITSAPDKVAG